MLVAWVVNWLLTLIVGRSPTVLHRFLAAYVRYRTHVTAYLFLLTRRFPGFTGGLYELDVVVPGAERQSRLVTLFRLVLAVPALLVSAALAGLVLVAGFFGWFFALVTGRMPGGLRAAAVYATRYGAQTTAYMLVLTDRYPHSSPPVAAEPVEAAPYAVADAPA